MFTKFSFPAEYVEKVRKWQELSELSTQLNKRAWELDGNPDATDEEEDKAFEAYEEAERQQKELNAELYNEIEEYMWDFYQEVKKLTGREYEFHRLMYPFDHFFD